MPKRTRLKKFTISPESLVLDINIPLFEVNIPPFIPPEFHIELPERDLYPFQAPRQVLPLLARLTQNPILCPIKDVHWDDNEGLNKAAAEAFARKQRESNRLAVLCMLVIAKRAHGNLDLLPLEVLTMQIAPRVSEDFKLSTQSMFTRRADKAILMIEAPAASPDLGSSAPSKNS